MSRRLGSEFEKNQLKAICCSWPSDQCSTETVSGMGSVQCNYSICVQTFKIFFVFSGTTCLSFEEDPEPFGKERDRKIIKICKDLNIEVIQVVSHTLYKLEK